MIKKLLARFREAITIENRQSDIGPNVFEDMRPEEFDLLIRITAQHRCGSLQGTLTALREIGDKLPGETNQDYLTYAAEVCIEASRLLDALATGATVIDPVDEVHAATMVGKGEMFFGRAQPTVA